MGHFLLFESKTYNTGILTLDRTFSLSLSNLSNILLFLCSFSLPYEILRPLMTILFNINYTNMVSKGATHIISFNILFQNERHTNYINVSQTKDILKSLNKGNIAMKQLCI